MIHIRVPGELGNEAMIVECIGQLNLILRPHFSFSHMAWG